MITEKRVIPSNKKYKDSVFTDLFSDTDSLLDLYLTFHPEDTIVDKTDVMYQTCEECAKQHEQLATWLEDLKRRMEYDDGNVAKF